MTLTNYWWLLIWIFGAGVFFFFVRPQRSEMVLGKREWRWNIPAAIVLIAPYIVWAGWRGNTGDTYAYRKSFSEMPTAIGEWGIYINDLNKDQGFSVLGLLIKHFFGNSAVIYFLILAAIQILCISMVFRKYSCDYWFSIFVFIATGDYISWMFNGIRQFTAATLIFAATTLMLKKKYISVILVILLASTMHQSALLMLPVVFIIQGKAFNKRAIVCVILCVLALVFADQFTNVLDTLLSDTQYTNVVSDWQEWEDDGMNPIRALVYSMPTILAVIGYRCIKQEHDPVINFAVNASMISTGLSIIAVGTSGIFIGRLPIYTSMYAMSILLPWEIENIFTVQSARLIKIAAVICFAAFFYYQMHYTWGML